MISNKIKNAITEPIKSNVNALELKLYDNKGRKISTKEMITPTDKKIKPIFNKLRRDILFLMSVPLDYKYMS